MSVLIAGMGLSGKACAQYFHQQGQPFHTFDDRKTAGEVEEALGFSGFTHHVSPPPLGQFHKVIVSPGIAAQHPVVTAAHKAGVPVHAEIELAASVAKGRIIAVTGSNGKSTTASLIHHMLASNGLSAILCGNIGVPFISVAKRGSQSIFVVEASSFQLEHIHRFRAHTGILLNLSPDHLDRHGSLEAYAAAKLRIFENQREDDRALFHPEFLGRVPGLGQKIPVPGPDFSTQNSQWCLGDKGSVATDQLSLIGRHNRRNALFAAAAAALEGLESPAIAAAFASFKGLEHRMEAVGEWEGRLWINDSKATNTHATQAAVNAMEQPYVLILGGCDKGERFNLNLSPAPRAIVAYGETAALVLEDLADHDPIHVHDFSAACRRAHQLAQPGDAVLLAPACASFDQFPNFMARGHRFKEIFRELRS